MQLFLRKRHLYSGTSCYFHDLLGWRLHGESSHKRNNPTTSWACYQTEENSFACVHQSQTRHELGFAAKKIRVYLRKGTKLQDTGEPALKDLAPQWPLGDRLYGGNSLAVIARGVRDMGSANWLELVGSSSSGHQVRCQSWSCSVWFQGDAADRIPPPSRIWSWNTTEIKMLSLVRGKL